MIFIHMQNKRMVQF